MLCYFKSYFHSVIIYYLDALWVLTVSQYFMNDYDIVEYEVEIFLDLILMTHSHICIWRCYVLYFGWFNLLEGHLLIWSRNYLFGCVCQDKLYPIILLRLITFAVFVWYLIHNIILLKKLSYVTTTSINDCSSFVSYNWWQIMRNFLIYVN